MSQHESSRKFTGHQAIRTLAFPSAVILSGAMVWGGSTAAFSDTTENADNAWSTGTVDITDNRQGMTGSAMFAATNIVPGYEETRCITVTSNSSVDTELKMYAAAEITELAGKLSVAVSTGGPEDTSLSVSADCTNFKLVTGAGSWLSLNDIPATYEKAMAGAVLPAGEDRTYRITVKLPAEVENMSTRAPSAAATFTWEARSVTNP